MRKIKEIYYLCAYKFCSYMLTKKQIKAAEYRQLYIMYEKKYQEIKGGKV